MIIMDFKHFKAPQAFWHLMSTHLKESRAMQSNLVGVVSDESHLMLLSGGPDDETKLVARQKAETTTEAKEQNVSFRG